MALLEYVVKSPTLDQKGEMKNVGDRIVYDDTMSKLEPKEFKALLDKSRNLGPIKDFVRERAEPEGSAQTGTPAVDYNLVNAAVEAQVLAVLENLGLSTEQIAAARGKTQGDVEEEAPTRTKPADDAAEADKAKGAFDPVAVIDGNVDTASKRLAGLDAKQLDAVRKAEADKGEAARKGLLDAIDAAKAAL